MNIVLFDMDGTLTEARKKISDDMITSLCALSNHARIGILTGSGIDYVIDQVGDLFETIIDAYAFPCNGTQVWTNMYGNLKKHHEATMIEEIGAESFYKLCRLLIIEHERIVSQNPDMPLTGNFIDNRVSTLNFCPPGRGCNVEQRNKFVELDNKRGIRQKSYQVLQGLLNKFGLKDSVDISLGGNTSIDVYPRGWDKTYVMRHFTPSDKFDKVFFVGDRCDEGGNDKAIYDLLQPEGRSFKTTSPENTIEIIHNQIIPALEGL